MIACCVVVCVAVCVQNPRVLRVEMESASVRERKEQKRDFKCGVCVCAREREVHTYIYVRTYVYKYVCMHVCMHACTHVVYMCVVYVMDLAC